MKKEPPKTAVAVLIDNPISRDYRVIKEAQSLIKNSDLHVSVIGLIDQNTTEVFENIEENLDYYRVKADSIFDEIKRLMRATPVTIIGSLFILTLATFVIYTITPLPKIIKIISLFYFLSIVFRLLLEPKVPGLKKLFHQDPLYGPLKSRLNLHLQKLKINSYKQSYSIQIEELKPEILHCHDFPMLEVGCHYKNKFDSRVKIVYDSHELYEHMANKSKFHQKYFANRLKELQLHIDQFITINQFIGEYYNKHFPKLPKAIIINNSLPLARLKEFNFELRKVSPLRKKIKADPEDIVILFQGVFNKERQLDEIIKAITKVERKDLKLVFMGWGQAEKMLKNLIEELNLLKKVFILPGVSQTELLEWTQGADLGLIPYSNSCLNHYYCSPNKLWEYASAAVPILAPDFPFIKGQLEKYNCGLTIREINESEVANAFNKINKNELLEKSKNCAKFIQESHWELNEKTLQNLYSNFIN